MKFGEKLYDLRRKSGLSQEQLAEKLNVTRQTISKWELGQSTPDAQKLVEVSKVLNADINELTTQELSANKKTYDPSELHPRKWLLIVLVIVEIIIAIILINKVVMDRKSNKEEGSWGIFDVFKNAFEMQSETSKKFDISAFNNGFSTLYSGEEYGTSVKSLIDAIITSNKTNKEHQIAIKYNNETLDDNKISELKRSINTWDKYDISYDYNDAGYIIVANIELLEQDKSAIESFNNDFEFSGGEQGGTSVKHLIDKVITSNHKNPEHLISVTYGSTNTTDENEMRNLKDNFVDFLGYNLAHYEVIIGYDDAGYVNQITIQDK